MEMQWDSVDYVEMQWDSGDYVEIQGISVQVNVDCNWSGKRRTQNV